MNKEPVVWAYDDAPFTGDEVRELLEENERMRRHVDRLWAVTKGTGSAEQKMQKVDKILEEYFEELCGRDE